MVNVDIRQNLSSTAGIDTTSVTQTKLFLIYRKSCRLFDDRITVSTANGSFTVNDEEGRRLKITRVMEVVFFLVMTL